MKEKKTTKRLLPMMDLEDLSRLYNEDGGEGQTVMRRRRDGGLSEKTNPWEDFDEKEGINTLLYTYELQAGPQLRLNGKFVMAYSPDGEELEQRPLEYVRTVCMLARKYKEKRTKEVLNLSGYEDNRAEDFAGEKDLGIVRRGEPGYEVYLHPDGEVRVGCQPFFWEEIDAFAKKMCWWK